MEMIYFEPTLTSREPLRSSGVHAPQSSGKPEGAALAPTCKNEVQDNSPHGLPGKFMPVSPPVLICLPQYFQGTVRVHR